MVNAIGASFDEILAPQMKRGSETIDRIQRLILQCSQWDQELLLALIDKMLDTREKQEKKINAVGFLDTRPRLSLSADIRANLFYCRLLSCAIRANGMTVNDGVHRHHPICIEVVPLLVVREPALHWLPVSVIAPPAAVVLLPAVCSL